MNSTIDIHLHSSFHNVGQGLFYSCSLNHNNINPLTLVYDCGSLSTRIYLEGAVDRYAYGNCNSRKIDFLILSHFHADHINGIDRILSHNIHISKVFLPYLTPAERLLISLGQSKQQDWYYDFLSDPVTFLLNQNVGQVILIGPGRTPDSEPDISEEDPENKFFIELAKDLDLSTHIDTSESWKEEPSRERLKVFNHHGKISGFNRLWIFKFYCSPIDERLLDVFKMNLEINGIDPKSPQSIKEAIKCALKRRVLGKAYKRLSKDLNTTSLVLFHGPVYDRLNKIELKYCPDPGLAYSDKVCPYSYFGAHSLCKHIGHLLTGDINFKKTLQDVIQHIGKDLFTTIYLGLAPHHGSINNWDNSILGSTSSPCYWVVSSGISNKFGHPDLDVLSNIMNTGHNWDWCNEIRKLDISGTVSFN